MSNLVIQIAKKNIPQLRQHYLDYLQQKKPPYSAFVAKKNNVTITAYESGKIMFQGENGQKELDSLHLDGVVKPSAPGASKKTPPTALAPKTSPLPDGFAAWSVMGSDEVSTGSYFGSAVYAATYVNKESIATLQALGVKDSKMLTDKAIVSIAAELKKTIPYYVYELTPEKYNDIQPKYNAVHMKVVAHHYILSELAKQLDETPDAILIDAFTSEKNFYSYLARDKMMMPKNTYLITKGEQYHLSVAAASIIARAAFLESFAQMQKVAGLALPLSANDEATRVAAKLIKRGGLPLLGQFAKLHFANTAKAVKLAEKM